MNDEIAPRVGNFFIIVGCALLVLFIGSIMSRGINILYIFSSAFFIFIGYLFRRRIPRKESTRFSAIRSARQRSKQRRVEKQEKKDKKE